MAAEWVGHPQGLVAQVDCTTDEDLCDDVVGLPTLRYGDPSGDGAYLQEYRLGKNYEELSQFANETLGQPMCSPGNLDPCDTETRAQMKSVLSLSEKELEAAIAEKEEAIEAAKQAFTEAFNVMQAKYDKLGIRNRNDKGSNKERDQNAQGRPGNEERVIHVNDKDLLFLMSCSKTVLNLIMTLHCVRERVTRASTAITRCSIHVTIPHHITCSSSAEDPANRESLQTHPNSPETFDPNIVCSCRSPVSDHCKRPQSSVDAHLLGCSSKSWLGRHSVWQEAVATRWRPLTPH